MSTIWTVPLYLRLWTNLAIIIVVIVVVVVIVIFLVFLYEPT